MTQFERQTGFPRSYAVLGFVGVYFLMIFLNFGGVGQLLSNIAGFIVPGYYSILALQTATSKDDTQILTYWVVFAFLNVIEFWSKAILYWIPFYYLFKTIFLLYIGLPYTGGAEIIYKTVIKPVSDQYVRPIDSKIGSNIGSSASSISGSGSGSGSGFGHSNFGDRSHENFADRVQNTAEGVSTSVHI